MSRTSLPTRPFSTPWLKLALLLPSYTLSAMLDRVRVLAVISAVTLFVVVLDRT